LLDAEVCVDTGISGGAREVLVLSVGNVLFGSRVSVLLGQTKINDEQLVAVSPDAHEKVVWLNVSMNEVLVVDKLNSPYHLYTIMWG
jgi:hypothetical protein